MMSLNLLLPFLILVLLPTPSTPAFFNARGGAIKQKMRRRPQAKRKLSNDRENTDLIMFTGPNCDHCQQMQPHLERLER